MKLILFCCVAVLSLTSIASSHALFGKDSEDRTISLADGKYKLQTPESWDRKQPQTNIVEHEFSVPPAKGDASPGRVTVMSAGGTAEANVERWIGQFTQPGGAATKDRTKITKTEIAGLPVQFVDISGTYKDQRGPFAPAVEREKYRMLSAIISIQGQGNYFIKFYGPENTVAENAKDFQKMIEGLRKG